MHKNEYFDDAISLVEYCEKSFERIKISYKESLSTKTIKRELLIEIKNFVENLRSALDYSAHGIYESYGDHKRTNPEIYFPYAWKTINAFEFSNKNLIEKKLPGVQANRPDIADKIILYQHFSSDENIWLPKFMELTNKNKHQKLTPQTNTEQKEMISTFPNGKKIVFKNGAGINADSFHFGDQIFEGRQTYNADNPLPIIGVMHEIKIWSSFNFSYNNEPVLPLLEKSFIEVKKIVLELSVM